MSSPDYNDSKFKNTFLTSRPFLRFKDNNIIDKSIYSYDKHLELSNVTGLTGKYRCRVVNDYGSEFSNVADLRVFSKCTSVCCSKKGSGSCFQR